MILVASVMHTGTLFTMYKLLDNHPVEQCHFTTKHYGRMTKKLEDSERVVIPLRHPARCLETFKRRNKEYSDFKEQWDNMIERAESMNPYYIHIDDPVRRDEDAKRLNLVDVDWKPSVRAGMKTFTYDLEITDELLAGIPQQYIEFYERQKQ